LLLCADAEVGDRSGRHACVFALPGGHSKSIAALAKAMVEADREHLRGMHAESATHR
jgi:hypothetical protein